MRISGGDLRGRTVHCPPGVIRPAMDRMRESMFTILGPLEEMAFLDLFSGSALVGLEAYSRGARPVVLVEKDPGKRRVIQRNIADLDPPPQLRLEPVERFVARGRTPFDVIYLDPPFDYRFKQDLLRRVTRSRLVRAGTRVLIHQPAREETTERFGRAGAAGPTGALLLRDRREYGGSAVCFYEFDPGISADADNDAEPR